MPARAAWIVGLMLSTLVGAIVGYGNGSAQERAEIANECRKAQAFTVKRTGFACFPIRLGHERQAHH